MANRHEGISVLITGVAGNLGLALRDHFLVEGAAVFGLDRDTPAPPESGEDRFFTAECDLRDPEGIRGAIDSFEGGESGFDLVVNNAGLIYNSPLIKFEDGAFVTHDFQRWRDVIDVNLSAAFYVSACCIEKMVPKGKKGVVINISSICANGNVGQPAYSASKAGINGLTMALAKELGPLGIRVAAIAPGYVSTNSTWDNVDDQWLTSVRKSTPTRKLVSVESFVGAVDFILGNKDFTGKILEIDGGLTI